MIKFYRVNAIINRHLILTFRDFHRFIDLIYWPLLDIIVWGFTARWLQGDECLDLCFSLLTALIFLQILIRAQIEVSFSFLDELWSNNLVNLFSTPLQLSEWIISVMIIGFLKCIFTFLFGAGVIAVLYHLNILKIGGILFIFFPLIILSGWTIGFLTTSAVTYWGQKVQTLVWVVGWFFAPFSGVFYPISVLPQWAQYFSAVIPMSYLFEGIRITTTTGVIPKVMIMQCLGLNVLYLTLALGLFVTSFCKSKEYGLARLERYE